MLGRLDSLVYLMGFAKCFDFVAKVAAYLDKEDRLQVLPRV